VYSKDSCIPYQRRFQTWKYKLLFTSDMESCCLVKLVFIVDDVFRIIEGGLVKCFNTFHWWFALLSASGGLILVPRTKLEGSLYLS